MNVKKLICSAIFLFSLPAFSYSEPTGIYGYYHWFTTYVADYFQQLEQPTTLEIQRRNNPALRDSYNPQLCYNVLAPALNRGDLDIRYALGYFDHSTGSDAIWNNQNYGISPSLDIEVYNILRNTFTEPCRGMRIVCGFQESGDPEQGKTVYSKLINILGRNTQVAITLTYASASNNFLWNTNQLQDRQQFLTAQAEDNFFGGLSQADMVFYNGHSRDGGGPDFNPPVLDVNKKINYRGYYIPKQIGIKHVLSSIKQNPNPGFIYGSFSCYSQKHFYKMLTTAAPNMRLVLSSDTVDYADNLLASLGYLEGLLQGRCGEDLAQFAKRGKQYENFKGYNFR